MDAELLWLQMCAGSRCSYVLFTEQLQVVPLRRAAHPPLSLQHLQLGDVSSLVALHHGRCRVHGELLHPDNTSALNLGLNDGTKQLTCIVMM